MASARCSCGSNCSGCSTCSAVGNCMWDCSGCGGCDGSCSGSCYGSCSGSCSGCSGACNVGCNTTESVSLVNITLTTQFNAENITNIARLIYLEAARRGNTATNTSFYSGKIISASDISTLIYNLSLAGQTASYSASSGSIGYAALGNDLIDKAKAAYNTQINL